MPFFPNGTFSRFISGKEITIGGKSTGRLNTSKFTFVVDEVMFFSSSDVESNKNNHRRLYIQVPQDRLQSPWDCIYDDGKATVFSCPQLT